MEKDREWLFDSIHCDKTKDTACGVFEMLFDYKDRGESLNHIC